MALNRLAVPSMGHRAPSIATLICLESALAGLRISHQPLSALVQASKRHASHQAQGRANGAKDGPGKRLGAKKSGGEYVVPGNILFKQRGTHWFPGENCFMGRDHTIHAGAPGYVRYYRDPRRHPTRKYIGIALQKELSLPTPPNAARRRQLGMLAYQMPSTASEYTTGDLMSTDDPTVIRDVPNNTRQEIFIRPTKKNPLGTKLTLRPGYQYRQANYEIGRIPERKEALAQEKGRTTKTYPDFKPGDRFAAWRKSSVRIAKNRERKAMGRGKKGGGKTKTRQGGK